MSSEGHVDVGLREHRERVIARLSHCYERDLLDVDELDRMLDLAHAASTIAELDALVSGLAPDSNVLVVTTHSTDDPSRLARKRLDAMFSTIERTGHWVVARELIVQMTFGNVLLDFRDVSISPGVTILDVRILFGSLELLLPPWLSIDVDVSSLGGTVEERHRVPSRPDPARPILHVVGSVRFGSLEISTRLPGESRTDARTRERRERKESEAAYQALRPGRGLM